MRVRLERHLITLAALAVAACHDSTGPQPAGVSLRYSGAAGVTDTIEAVIPQALVVEVHDSTGALAPAGTVVRFTAVSAPGFRGSEVLVEPLTASFYSSFATGTTDQAGKTGVLVRLGNIAGPARLAVNVPTLGIEDTVRFTVKPGNAVAVLVTPADTALYVGKSYTMRGGAADRWGNPRTDAVTWSSLGSGVTVSSAGVVTATALGRYQIKADGVLNGVNGTSSGWVSVVPPGRLAVVGISADFQSMNLFAVDMDGSNKITLATVTDGGIGVHPAWIPGTSTVAYTTVVGGYQKLFTVGADGVPTPFFSSTPAGVTHQAEPTPTADGKWIYFSAYDTQCSQFDYCVARAKVDGSGYQLLVPSPSRQPAPSPDGSKVAFVSPNDYSLRVLDVASNTVSTWSVFGSTPTWSPDGTRIAYRDNTGSVSVVSPDGTGQRVLSTTSTSRVFGWSPDNKWVLMQTNNGTALLDAVSGTTLPVSSPLNSVPWSMK